MRNTLIHSIKLYPQMFNILIIEGLVQINT